MADQNDKTARNETARKLGELGKRLRYAFEHSDQLNLSPELKEALRKQFETPPPLGDPDEVLTCPNCGRHFAIKDVLTVIPGDLKADPALTAQYPYAPFLMIVAKYQKRHNEEFDELTFVACPRCQTKLPPEFLVFAFEQLIVP